MIPENEKSIQQFFKHFNRTTGKNCSSAGMIGIPDCDAYTATNGAIIADDGGITINGDLSKIN